MATVSATSPDVDRTTLNLATQQYEFRDDALTVLDAYLTGNQRDTTLELRRAQFSREWLREKMRPRQLASAYEIFRFARASYYNFMPTVLLAVVLGATCGAI